MSSTPEAMPERGYQMPVRASSVLLGRQDSLSVILRLVGMELYKIRRRAMSKVFSIISLVVVIGAFLVISLATIYAVNSPPTAFVPPSCAQSNNAPGCTTQQPSAAQANQAKQTAILGYSEPLRLPLSLNIVTTIIDFLGEILIIILAGSIVGGDYSVGTVRLMFTRGPTRGQFLLGKIGALIVCIVLAFVVLTLLGILSGLLLNFISGVAPATGFFTAGWLVNALLYTVLCMLSVFVYAMMALFLATMGRSTAAGVAGALGWALIEPVVGSVLKLVGTLLKGTTGSIISAIPDYFVSNNLSTLIQNQGQNVFNSAAAQISNLHALIVIAVYLVIFIGLSWWITVRRDVTN